MNEPSVQHPDQRVLQNIHARRSVRTYVPTSLDNATIQTLLDTAVHAPTAMGLGSCVVGSAVSALNIGKVKAKLGIPDNYFVVAPLVFGVPGGKTPAASRKEPQILS